ncbi:MAG: sorbosone dehydrogenase family protein, partial [Bradyrhizobium sp.]
MISISSVSRRVLLAGAVFGAFTLAAAAQQPASPPASGAAPAAQPLPPGSPLIGRPDSEAAAKLAPVAHRAGSGAGGNVAGCRSLGDGGGVVLATRMFGKHAR